MFGMTFWVGNQAKMRSIFANPPRCKSFRSEESLKKRNYNSIRRGESKVVIGGKAWNL
jgi:hypothetical protein